MDNPTERERSASASGGSARTLGRLLFEFIIIVFGVLTAFGVQEFAQSVSDDEQRFRYLTSVKAELLENRNKLDKVIHGAQRQDSATAQLISTLDRHIVPDSSL